MNLHDGVVFKIEKQKKPLLLGFAAICEVAQADIELLPLFRHLLLQLKSIATTSCFYGQAYWEYNKEETARLLQDDTIIPSI